MKTIIISILLIYFSIELSYSQNALRFDNVITSDTVYVFRNDRVKLLYHGYLNQLEETKGRVLNIDNTSIFIGKKIFGITLQKKQIKITDLYGFKKYTIFRRIANGVVVATIIGGSIILPQLIGIESVASAYALSSGIGITGSVLTSLLFNDNIKNTLKSGWKFVILYPKK